MSEKPKDIILEREYVIPLRKVYFLQKNKRAARAIRTIREFVKKHVKAEKVIITNKLNEYVWKQGIEKPPRRVKVKVIKTEDNIATVILLGE